MDSGKTFLGLTILFSVLIAVKFKNTPSWEGALIGGLITIAGFYSYYLYKIEKRKKETVDLEKGILERIPLGIVAIDLNGEICWYNAKFKQITGRRGFLAGKISQYLPNLQFKKNSFYRELMTEQIAIKNKIYQLNIFVLDENLRLIFLGDITEHTIYIQKNQVTKPVIGIIQIDNYAEALEAVGEEVRPLLFAELDKIISDWALEKDAYIRKFTNDKYLVFLTEEYLKQAEENGFEVLDKVRSLDFGKIPVTISMGFGTREDSLIELGRLAHLSLELALGRGGDQVVVKSPEKVWFYGGKSPALEKRTKVKARVIAHSLKEMILEASSVIIMGHESADFDSLGSSLGLASAIRKLGKVPYIIIDPRNESFDKLITVLGKDKFLGTFIRPTDIRRIETEGALLIVVDTHKPSMVIEPNLLNVVDKIVIIDHHRRSEEFINNASLIYLETYASSASELVTEIIQYLDNQIEIDSWAATALLAGITVDTKNFIFQTGVRTFEAASYLRRVGADPVLVQKLLRDDFAKVTKKAVI
ncbi:MAG: DHH family phosphoesterase, partial [Peptococcales bacterium]